MNIQYFRAVRDGRLTRDWVFDKSPGFTVTMVFEEGDIGFYYVSTFNNLYAVQKGNPYEPYPYAVPNDIWITKEVFDIYFEDIPDPGFPRDFPPINTDGTSGTSGKAEFPMDIPQPNTNTKSGLAQHWNYSKQQMLSFAETCMIDLLSTKSEHSELPEISSLDLHKIKQVLLKWE
jgi:hypothetical protein